MPKKILFATVLFTLVLSACSGSATPSATVTPTPASSAQATAIPTTGPATCTVSGAGLQPKADSAATFAPISDSDHVLGPATAVMTVIIYSDFTCPYCQHYTPAIEQFQRDHPNDVRLVYRSFSVGHTLSEASIAIAEAANLQGKYWEMHDKLYATQNEWNQLTGADRTDYFVQAAESIGVNGDELRDAISNNKDIKKKIDFDTAMGKKVEITGTPGIFVNGENFSDKRVKDGKFTDDTKASYVWNDVTTFENLVIKPALKKAGVSTDE